ncbi:hypothetical protein M378DRAFT_162099 [Amanita muscaria Koide BX008]|uniref:Cytochrome P450 n=1 Tax=Amanita muscaria (strain Koide BX008) TaxID=946122 RepID=A0A0C2X9K2_AMAMK|nr:hypothetical protein M378DRAFT_162099 [Amanita muscaria Koide BX008]
MVLFDSVHTDAMRGNDSENLKHQFVSLSVDYVLFGHGRRACPGRFFVANERKVMLSHVLLNYDIKMAD